MQGYLLVDSYKSTGGGPVHSPVSGPLTKNKKTHTKTKATKQTKHTKPQPNKNKQKPQGRGIATSNGNNMHDDILCVIMSMATEKETKPRKHRTTQGGQAKG